MAFSGLLMAEDVGLLGHWKFDEGEGQIARDSSSNNVAGRIHGGRWVQGVSGGGLELSGESWVEFDDAGLYSITSEFTLEIWVKNLEPGAFTLFAKGFWGNGWQTTLHEKYISLASKGIEGVAKTSYGKFRSGEAQPFRHIAITRSHPESSETATLFFYVDGRLQHTNRIVGELRANAIPLVIVKSASRESGYMQGIIDEARIFRRALSEDEISARYEELDHQTY